MKNQKKKQRNPKDLPTCAAAGRWEEGRGTRRGSGGVSPQPSGDAGRGAARSGRGGRAPSAWSPPPFAESGSSALESQRKQGVCGEMSLSFSFLDWPCASSAPGSVLRCPGTYTDLLAFPPARSTASSPGSSASSSPDPGLGPARPGRRLQFVRSLHSPRPPPRHHPMAEKLLSFVIRRLELKRFVLRSPSPFQDSAPREVTSNHAHEHPLLQARSPPPPPGPRPLGEIRHPLPASPPGRR